VLEKFAAAGLIVIAARGQTPGASPLERARRAFDAGRYAEAAGLFEAARITSSACDLPLFLGLTRYRLHQVDEALIGFQEAARCDPKLTLAWIALGEAYTERGNEVEALAAYDRALGLEPENTAALRGAAALYMRAKMTAKAVAALDILTKQNPGDSELHSELGAAYFGTGNLDAAETEFNQALKLAPKSSAALLGQANLLLRKGDEGRAIELLQRVIRVAPKAYEPRFVLGSAYNRLSRFAEAAAELEAAVKLGAVEPEVYYHLARAYGGLGRTEKRTLALTKFAELSKQAKADTEARRQAARLVEQAKPFVDAGNLPDALKLVEQARDLRPQDDNILFRLASLDYDLARYAPAHDAIEEAIALAPSEWVYRLLAGLIEGRSGELEEARRSLSVAVRLNPAAADAHNALGEVSLRLGDVTTAEASFRRATELDPASAVFRANLETARKAAAK
jgi:tetratricopeptide (TPR) repeat protein